MTRADSRQRAPTTTGPPGVSPGGPHVSARAANPSRVRRTSPPPRAGYPPPRERVAAQPAERKAVRPHAASRPERRDTPRAPLRTTASPRSTSAAPAVVGPLPLCPEVVIRATPETRKARSSDVSESALPDSNRRPLPYHGGRAVAWDPRQTDETTAERRIASPGQAVATGTVRQLRYPPGTRATSVPALSASMQQARGDDPDAISTVGRPGALST